MYNPMYIDYYSPGSSTPSPEEVTIDQFAAYIMSEWIPNVPNSALNGMVDVVQAFLDDTFTDGDGKNRWTVSSDLSVTDRQWKGTTSWILGVAGARYAIEQEGYPWWAPVTAFPGPSSRGITATGDFSSGTAGLQLPPQSKFSIKRNPTANSRLLPDYLVCRFSNSGFEYAFFEAKGTNRAIGRWNNANQGELPQWRAQANSAELFFKGNPCSVNRNAIVATRVNPDAVRESTRKIKIRIWNHRTNVRQPDIQMFGHFLANHYTGICRRIGFIQLAKELEKSVMHRGNKRDDRDTQSSNESADPLPESSFYQLWGRVEPFFGDYRAVQPEESTLRVPLQDRVLTAGLTTAALDIIQVLLSNDWSDLSGLILASLQKIDTQRNLLKENQESPHITVLRNGVVIYALQ